jgi:hypothetical protein
LRSSSRRARDRVPAEVTLSSPWDTAPGRRTTSSASTSTTPMPTTPMPTSRSPSQQMGLADPRLPLRKQHPTSARRQPSNHLRHDRQLADEPDRHRRVLLSHGVLGRPQMPPLREPLQATATTVREPDRRDGANQLADNVGDEHLAARGTCRDPRPPPRADLVDLTHLARIDAKPHPRHRTGQGTLQSQPERHPPEWATRTSPATRRPTI